MSRRLSGINPLSYMGVEPATPPDLVIDTRRPATTDSKYNIGTLWVLPSTNQIWMLTQFQYKSVATWTILETGATAAGIFVTNNGNAAPFEGVLNVLGINVLRTSGSANTVSVELLNGLSGQLLIGGGAEPIWAYLTSSDNTITIDTTVDNVIDLITTGGRGVDTVETDSGIAFPDPTTGDFNIFGGPNINTSVGAADTMFVNLNTSILLPATTADELNGVISIGSALVNSFLHGFGTENTFTGPGAGNFTLDVTSINNTGVGSVTLDSLTFGTDNTAVGRNSLELVNTGSYNTAIGGESLLAVLTGSNNIAVGYNAGSEYIAAEDSNIVIGNIGVVGESNTIRIGSLVAGNGAGQQNACYIPSAYGVTVGGTFGLATVDNTGLVGTSAPIVGDGFLRTDASVISAVPDSVINGQVLISSATGVPIWASLTAGANVVVTPGANSIAIAAAGGGGGGGTTLFTTDVAGPAAPDGFGVINFINGSNISTDGTVANTINFNLIDNPSVAGTLTAATGLFATAGGLTVTAGNTTLTPLAGALPGTVRSDAAGVLSAVIDPAINGQVMISSAAGVPIWSSITSTGGSVTITPSANGINLEAAGVAALTQLTTDIGGPVAPLAGNINTIGGTNITTDGSVANTVSIALIASPTIAGTLTAANLTVGALTGGVVQASTLGVLSSSRGTNGQFLIGTSATTNPIWSSLTSTGGTVVISQGAGGPGTINLESLGGGGGGGASIFTTSAGTAVVATSTIQILSGANTNTDGGSNIVHINLNKSIVQPVTNATGTQGVYSLGASISVDPFMHGYGTNNTFLGRNAGSTPAGANLFTLTGVQNTGTGFNSLAGLTTGNYNTASGAQSLSKLTTGTHNSAFGVQALWDSTTGDYNTAIGFNALANATTSSENTSVGALSLTSLTTGTRNTAIGTRALNSTVTASDNVAVGYEVLKNLTTGVNNTAVGGQSAPLLNIANATTYIGFNAGASNTTGSANTGIGAHSLDSITTGNYNTALGYTAGSLLTAGNDGNLCIDHVGVSGDNYTARIGTNYTRMFIDGIYGKNAGTQLVFIDSLGQLGSRSITGGDGILTYDNSGTGIWALKSPGAAGQIPIANSGAGWSWTSLTAGYGITIGGGGGAVTISSNINSSFQMVLNHDVTNVTGDGTVYVLGTAAASTSPLGGKLTLKFETTPGSCYIGDNGATPARYTAPADGRYLLTATVTGNNFIFVAPPPTVFINSSPVRIVAGPVTYEFVKGATVYSSTIVGSVQAETCTVVADLDAGDIVTWAYYIVRPDNAKTIGLQGTAVTTEFTYVGGTLVA